MADKETEIPAGSVIERVIKVSVVVQEKTQRDSTYGTDPLKDVATHDFEVDMATPSIKVAAAVKTALDSMVTATGDLRPAIVETDEPDTVESEIAAELDSDI